MSSPYILQLDNISQIIWVFARVFAFIFFVPGFGERFITTQMKLLFSLVTAYVIYGALPASAAQNTEVFFALRIAFEVTVGVMLGMCLRIIFSALDVCGAVVGMKIGLSNAFTTSPISGASGPLPAAFLGMCAITILLCANYHHTFLRTLISSYDYFNFNDQMSFSLMQENILNMVFYVVVISFKLGLQLATPFVILGILYFLSLGILNRLMPQLPVFFVGQPLQLGMGLLIFMLTFHPVMQVFTQCIHDFMLQIWALPLNEWIQ